MNALLKILDWFATPFKWFGGLFSKNESVIVQEETAAVNSSLAAVAEPVDAEKQQIIELFKERLEEIQADMAIANAKKDAVSRIWAHSLKKSLNFIGSVLLDLQEEKEPPAGKSWLEYGRELMADGDSDIDTTFLDRKLAEKEANIFGKVLKHDIKASKPAVEETAEQEPAKTAGCTK